MKRSAAETNSTEASKKITTVEKYPVTLSHKYDQNKHNVTGWYCSEKLDGQRAYFNTATGELLSRNNKKVCVPDEWRDELSNLNLPLDGELYIGRNQFDKTMSVVRKTTNAQSQEWVENKVRYHVFDLIEHGSTFEDRLRKLKSCIPDDHPFITVVKQQIIRDNNQVEELLEELVADGAEGIMLKDGAMYYEHKRSQGTLKVKKFHDMEVVVESTETGKGKNTGKIGHLNCRLPSGTKVRVGGGFTDEERERGDFRPGDLITIRFFEMTKKGVPRFPVFVSIRTDIAPSDVGF